MKKWHRMNLSLNTVLRVCAMSKPREPIKARYTEADRQKWFTDLLALLKGTGRLAWDNVPGYDRPEGFTLRHLNDRHYLTAALAVMQGHEPVLI